jgi:DNA repair exonuclease SbcCD ATPase subunit
LLAALGPVREELAALRTRVADETAAALAAKAHADQAQAEARARERKEQGRSRPGACPGSTHCRPGASPPNGPRPWSDSTASAVRKNQARQNLRTATEQFDERVRARADEFDEQARSLRTAADQRVAELHSQLTQATQTYADSLAPLHAHLGQLRNEVVEQTATASALRQQLDDLRAALTDAVDETTADEPLHQRVAALLGQAPSSRRR